MCAVRQLGVAALSLLLLAATGASSVRISQAWVRPTPPGAPTAAVYARIENAGAEPERLLAVETDSAETAELHVMSKQDGMMVMRPVEGGLVVPAHGSLQLEPGGYHIMLIHPRRQIRPGDEIGVTFVFERAGRVTLQVPAQAGPGPAR